MSVEDLRQRLVVIEPELLHLNDEIQNLCKELNVVSLENDIVNVKDNFIRISNDIREKFDSHRSATVIVNDIKRNLANLEDVLSQCSIESRTRYDGDISEMKDQLERMMEVEKRLENIGDVYLNTEALIKRLATYNLYDLQSTEAALESFHRKWTSLKTDILRSEQILHQNIINNLPSRQACKEIILFIDAIKRLLNDDHGAPINNRETLQKLLKRYRNHLNKRRTILDDIHQRMTQYLKLTADIKTAILYEYSKSFNSVDKLFCYFLLFFSDADFKLAPFFHGYYQTRIHQRRKELDEIRQKSNRFNSSLIRLQSDTDRLLHTIEKAPDSAETLISEIDSTFSALQYLGGDLKKSLDISSSSDIDRELKDMASPVETIRDSLDRAKRSYEENETIRDRIEKILNKSFIKDVDLETSHLSQVNDLILTLTERKCHQQIIRSLEKKQEDILQDLLKSFVLLIFFYYLNLSLKNETTKTIENLDQKVQEQEKLRQNACTMLSIIQRTKVQLIELRPTINDETDQKLKKIDDDLTTNYELFEQSLNNYKLSELNAYNTIRDEYENLMENTLKIIQIIENKTQQSHGIDLRQNLDLLKDLTNEMQTHRSLIDRLQLLSSTLSSELIDTNERERVRRRLNEIIRRWTQLEQDLMSEEEMKNLTELYHYINRNCQQWLKQTRILINDLTNTRNVETFDQLIRKGKNISFEYRTSLEHLQRLRNRLNQLVQTNRTPQASQKLNEVDRLLNEMTTCRENLEQRLDLFYEQWLENIQRTHDTISEQTLTTDEKVTTLS
ncbi:unnamed protein product [Rotaria sordida]|uniref:Uncharacterized protein n=1 Tax=Rotaria sordida TaxID=392033 RepID=A0A814RJU9_9BILA|nr:unnamed protein product [Rotaria sordida]